MDDEATPSTPIPRAMSRSRVVSSIAPLLGLLAMCTCASASADPPGSNAVTRETARAVAGVTEPRSPNGARLNVPRPSLAIPPRAGVRRVFETVVVEPWVRSHRVGLRMSASF